jgi:hypothetical protein
VISPNVGSYSKFLYVSCNSIRSPPPRHFYVHSTNLRRVHWMHQLWKRSRQLGIAEVYSAATTFPESSCRGSSAVALWINLLIAGLPGTKVQKYAPNSVAIACPLRRRLRLFDNTVLWRCLRRYHRRLGSKILRESWALRPLECSQNIGVHIANNNDGIVLFSTDLKEASSLRVCRKMPIKEQRANLGLQAWSAAVRCHMTLVRVNYE